jgi:hypothetical protein
MKLVPCLDTSKREDGIDDILRTDECQGWKVLATAEVFLDIPGTSVNSPGKGFGVDVLESIGGIVGPAHRVKNPVWIRYGDFVD